MYYFTLDGISNINMKTQVAKRPSFPSPIRNYKEYNIPGRDGILYQDMGTYDDIRVKFEMNYIDNPDLWHERWRKIKKWLLKPGIRKLSTSDDLDYCWKVKKIELSDNERRVKESGEFTITFVLEGVCYYKEGLNEFDATQVLYNRYDVSKPIYKIKGEGVCHLLVNGIDVTCNVGQNLTIDTDLQICYREDKTLQNTAINQDYDDLYLVSGQNTISITDGFDLKIIPNWRCT